MLTFNIATATCTSTNKKTQQDSNISFQNLGQISGFEDRCLAGFLGFLALLPANHLVRCVQPIKSRKEDFGGNQNEPFSSTKCPPWFPILASNWLDKPDQVIMMQKYVENQQDVNPPGLKFNTTVLDEQFLPSSSHFLHQKFISQRHYLWARFQGIKLKE